MTEDADQAQALLERGASLYEEGKLYEALSCWKQVVQLDPENEIANEYLRFIEENFQIGVDAFIEQHDSHPTMARPPAQALEAQPSPPPAQHPPPSVAAGLAEGRATPPPIPSEVSAALRPQMPPPPSIPDEPAYESIDDSIVELDWSEVLDEGGALPGKPPPVQVADDSIEDAEDEDFFREIGAGSLDAPPGEEATAWGAAPGSVVSRPVEPGRPAAVPDIDPVAQPIERFAAPYRPPRRGETGSVSKEILPSEQRRRRSAPMEVIHQRRRANAPIRVGTPSGERELSDMSDESLSETDDAAFDAWAGASEEAVASQDGAPPELGGPVLGSGAATSIDAGPMLGGEGDLAAELSVGLDVGAPDSMGSIELGEPTPPPEPDGATVEPEAGGGPDGSLEALVRASLAGLDQVSPSEPAPPDPTPQIFTKPAEGADVGVLMEEARKRHAAGDFTGSLQAIEQVLTLDASHPEALAYVEENTSRLLGMYRSKLGDLGRTPKIRMSDQELIWQSLDHRAGFVLSQVDGMTSYEDLVEISGMSELEATRVLARLVEMGVIR